jgi:hypothetical protein
MHRSIDCILCKNRIDGEAEEKSWEGRKLADFNKPKMAELVPAKKEFFWRQVQSSCRQV